MGINIRRRYTHTDPEHVLTGKFTHSQGVAKTPFDLQVSDHLIALNVKAEDHHWLSPEMSLRIETEDDETTIYEAVGPNSSMFTLAMFLILLGSVVFLAALMMALSQLNVGDSAFLAVTAAILSGLLIALTFGMLAMGRMKAADQVHRLREGVAEILNT